MADASDHFTEVNAADNNKATSYHAEFLTEGSDNIDGSNVAGEMQNHACHMGQPPHLAVVVQQLDQAAVVAPQQQRPGSNLGPDRGHDHGAPAMPVNDCDEEREVRKILTYEAVDGVKHYGVDWKPTLMPAYALENVWPLVQNFRPKKQAQHRPTRQKPEKRRPPNKSKADWISSSQK